MNGREPSVAVNSRGLTLIELLAVLVILVAVASVAVVSTDGLVDQSRFDATQRTLDQVEAAILGQPDLRQANGQPWITGFVADMGRLPRVIGLTTTDVPPKQLGDLSELWLQGSLPSASLQGPTWDPDIRLPGGWRGPYLRLPLGASRLVDGWGRDIWNVYDPPAEVRTRLFAPDQSPALPGAEATVVKSLGLDDQDGPVGSTSHDQDLAIVVSRTTPLVAARHLGNVAISVTPSSTPGAGAFVVVRLFAPVDGVVRCKADWQSIVSSSDGTKLHQLLAVPIGPRAIRAYQVDTPPLSPDAPIAITAPRSDVVTFTVVGGPNLLSPALVVK